MLHLLVLKDNYFCLAWSWYDHPLATQICLLIKPHGAFGGDTLRPVYIAATQLNWTTANSLQSRWCKRAFNVTSWPLRCKQNDKREASCGLLLSESTVIIFHDTQWEAPATVTERNGWQQVNAAVWFSSRVIRFLSTWKRRFPTIYLEQRLHRKAIIFRNNSVAIS